MDLRCPVKRWWRVLGLVVFLACGGCAEGAKLVQESASGGVVTYPYKEERGGQMFSGFRKGALGVMANKCPSGYTILREGETRGYSMVSGTTEGTGDLTTHRRWGLQFRCKST